ncbi:MAG TPA: diaminopimelate decarboxylase [Candidatus Nanoarchaeia archaeon]|nr:diaminopimelate decarboxylase [Candidatus Nanoarchaeia archaeon]
MQAKSLPFSKEKIMDIIKKYPTPFHIYDERAIRDNARKFMKAFSILPGFKEFFAVKVLPNPFVMKILQEEGFGTDCSSYPELLLSEKIGVVGEEIMFSSNDTPANEYKKAMELGAIINLDDISHIEFLDRHAGIPDLICFRYNPGPARTGNVIIGDPKEAKYGFTMEQLFEGYELCRKKGVKRFGLHTMVVSNELNPQSFIDTARMMFELATEIKERLGIKLEFVNFGGGMGIPQKPEDEALDYNFLAKEMKKLYDRLITKNGLNGLKVYLECGRVITGPYGYLVTTVLHLKHIYKDFVGCDACMANFMRPAIYGAYHHITVLGKETAPNNHVYDVTGSLCENNDKFAINRKLPEIIPSDILVIHDTGAHGFSMGFNYNGKLRSAELLLRQDGSVIKIRRAETVEDYFATLDFRGANKFR